MTHDEHVKQGEQTDRFEHAPYEQPRIEDYGTLAELTAGKEGDDTDFLGLQDERNGGGYS